MDLLFKRYASPFLLLDEMILAGELFDFIIHMVEQMNEEQEWEFFLHKVFDKSFKEFKDALNTSHTTQVVEMSESELETTVNESRNILTSFTPETEGGNK